MEQIKALGPDLQAAGLFRNFYTTPSGDERPGWEARPYGPRRGWASWAEAAYKRYACGGLAGRQCARGYVMGTGTRLTERPRSSEPCCPLVARSRSVSGAHELQPDLGGPTPQHPQLASRPLREVDNAVAGEGATVVHPNDDALTVLDVRNTKAASKR